MSIHSIPSGINAQHAVGAQGIAAKARHELKGLKTDLPSGDISGARNDFSAFVQLLQSAQQPGQSQTSSAGTSNTISTATQPVSSSSAQDAIGQLLKEL